MVHVIVPQKHGQKEFVPFGRNRIFLYNQALKLTISRRSTDGTVSEGQAGGGVNGGRRGDGGGPVFDPAFTVSSLACGGAVLVFAMAICRCPALRSSANGAV